MASERQEPEPESSPEPSRRGGLMETDRLLSAGHMATSTVSETLQVIYDLLIESETSTRCSAIDFPTSKLTPKTGQDHALRRRYECGGRRTNCILANSILSSTKQRWMSDGRLSRDSLLAIASLSTCISNDAPPHGSPYMQPIRDPHHGREKTKIPGRSYSVPVG